MSNSENNYYRNRNRNNNNAYRNQQENANYNRYYSTFRRLPGSRAERREMEEELNRMNRDAYENNRNRNNENGQNNNLPYFNPYKQEEKLVELHKYRPAQNMTMAEEIQQKYARPNRLERYIAMREREGVPFETALQEFQQGGIATEGEGTGAVVNNPYNEPYLLKKQNAKQRGLLNGFLGFFRGNGNREANPWGGSLKRKSRRKTRKTRKSRKTRRT
jgi:hypothetical protein